MTISQKKEGQKLTISVAGRVDTTTAPELEKYIFENAEGISELVFDLKDMEYTSSAGLRIFLKSQKLMNQQGTMKVIHVQSNVMDVLEIAGFTTILTIE